jgi:CheY-like chemotaxis protein/nitrogen-specific signal transduction histidine kinase
MKIKFYLLVPLILVFIGLSIRQYYVLNINQRKETADFVHKQIILCGKSIEDASNDFEELVKFEFADHDLKGFFVNKEDKSKNAVKNVTVENEIKRIRRFYSRNQVLISKIIIYNDSLYRSFERRNDNYFIVLPSQAFAKPVTLLSHTQLTDAAGELSYIQPIRNSEGNLVANIKFELNISNFLASHSDKFYIGNNSWSWAIDTAGQVLFHKHSEQSIRGIFKTDAIGIFQSKLKQNLSASFTHTIQQTDDFNVFSVFYPINILGKKTGIIFSVDTDSLWRLQNESNITIFVYFLVVIACIIALFSIIIRQMLLARKRLELTDALLRTANQASEVLLTDPDFDSAMLNFLEITAKAFGYQHAYLLEFTQKGTNQVYHLKYEWFDKSLVKPFSELIPEIIPGLETNLFQNIASQLFSNKLVKLNEPDFDNSYAPLLKKIDCKAFINLPVFVDKVIYGTIGFVDCKGSRQWPKFEDALVFNFANAVGGALSIYKKKQELISAKVLAETANRAKSEFLAIMGHEIRTPMNSIVGLSQVMLSKTDNPTQKNYLKIVSDSSKTLLSLIDDILILSKIEAGQMKISPDPADLRVAINGIKQLFHRNTEGKNLSFIIEIDDQLPQTIFIDELRLRQILLNLTGNAIKFTHTGFVKIEVKVLDKKNGKVTFEIAVIDSGIGIPDHDQQLIFESFSQLSGMDARKYGGTGLGLSISKRLLDLMNGTIRINSTPGQGSCFTVSFQNLDYSEEFVDAQNQIETFDEKVSFSGSKILIVDDVKFNRDLILAYLDIYDLKLFEAENGEAAIQMAKECVPDLILMDIRMPGMDGYQATKIIKSEKLTAHIPVIALTASIVQSEIGNLQTQFEGYLRKPMKEESMINELKKYLPYTILKSTNDVSSILQVEAPKTGFSTPDMETKALFETKFSQEISTQSESMINDSLIELAANMEAFAIQYKIPQLEIECVKLKSHIEAFDFDKIQNSLIQIKEVFKS